MSYRIMIMNETIESLEEEIERVQRLKDKVDSLRLGFLLKEHYYADTKYHSKRGNIENDSFLFRISCHETGVSVNSFIKLPDGERYKFADRTYWYNESQYGFNSWNYESGKWDKAYEEFIQVLRESLKQDYDFRIKQYEREISEEKERLQKEKSAVEDLF
jgi:hypothetical protein